MPTHLSGNSDPSCLRFSRICRLAQLHEALDKSVIIESNYLEMLKHPEHGGTKFNFAESEVHLKPHLQKYILTLKSLTFKRMPMSNFFSAVALIERAACNRDLTFLVSERVKE